MMEDEQDILQEIELKKKKKSFQSIINSGKFNETDLEDVMVDA